MTTAEQLSLIKIAQLNKLTKRFIRKILNVLSLLHDSKHQCFQEYR